MLGNENFVVFDQVESCNWTSFTNQKYDTFMLKIIHIDRKYNAEAYDLATKGRGIDRIKWYRAS